MTTIFQKIKMIRELSVVNNIVSYLKSIANMQKQLLQKGFKTTPAQFLLDYGRKYKIDENTYKGERDTPKECYRNATLISWKDSDLTYVEGYVTVRGIPIEHAWIIDRKKKVIDTTLNEKEEHTYFGVPINRNYLRKQVLKQSMYGILPFMSNPVLYRMEEQVLRTKVVYYPK